MPLTCYPLPRLGGQGPVADDVGVDALAWDDTDPTPPAAVSHGGVVASGSPSAGSPTSDPLSLSGLRLRLRL